MTKNICWIGKDEPRQLAIVAPPRAGQGLEFDLAALRKGGINVLVSMLCENEACDLGLADESATAGRLGMKFISCPVPDRSLPEDIIRFREIVSRLVVHVRRGRTVGVHCRACIGRSTVLLAALMVALGTEARQALHQIELAREYPVPDTPEQRAWILQFRASA